MATVQPQTTESTAAPKRIATGLATVFLAYFIYMYFIQILLSAMPKIAAELDGMNLYSWGVSIPNLGLAFSMLLVGKLSDMYGRRPLLLVCLTVCLAGTIWSALSSTFVMLIIARTFLSIGQGGLAPLCFSVLGDMFEPVQRSKWIGLLNIPAGAFAMIGPTLGGWFVEELSWRYIFWGIAPILIVCLLMVSFSFSGSARQAVSKIDKRGALLAAVASSTMILAFSMAGTMYPWASAQVIGLLAASIIFWVLFVKAEAVAEEPLLDLEVLKNRSFITIAAACLLSCFGLMGLMIYYPLLMQGVQGVSATLTGKLMTPGNVIMNFLGVGAGFIVARTRRCKWMFIVGYGITLVIMIVAVFFNASTPNWLAFVAFTIAGLGMGAIPTLNTLVAQYAVPKRLLGVAMGALYFSVMIGQALTPAILGSAQSMTYNSTLKATLPVEVSRQADQATLTSLGNPRVLLNDSAMASLKQTLGKSGPNGQAVVDQTVSAIRVSFEAGLRIIFIFGAVAMFLTFLVICTIPEISFDAPAEDNKPV